MASSSQESGVRSRELDPHILLHTELIPTIFDFDY